MTGVLARAVFRRRTWSRLTELAIFAAALAMFYAVLAIGRTWLGPFTPAAEISRSPRALPGYAAYSLGRIVIAYALSLAFALGYGYAAARSARAERLLLPLLDILQSIPVLSFLPGVMLAMVALFPRRQLGLELGAILLIFTGQAWNIAFSFYSSLKSIPRELEEAARIYRFSRWQRFTELELPYAAIGLVWNSMMSVAGGWFFLMACEMFVLGNRDFRLPGLGSYLQTAANAGDTRAILWGLMTMIGVIILTDQMVWRPVIAWAEKFKLEQVGSAEIPRSPILNLLRRSKLLPFVTRSLVLPLRERLNLHFAKDRETRSLTKGSNRVPHWARRAVAIVVLAAIAYAVAKVFSILATMSSAESRYIVWGAGATFLRVEAVLLLAALWTIPAGVAIGLRPKLSAIAQPIAQIAASVPATALFPIILLVLIRAGGGLGIGSIVLLLLGTQWYLLFNVIAGATAIPADLKEVCNTYQLSVGE